jgi:hypothetical protein
MSMLWAVCKAHLAWEVGMGPSWQIRGPRVCSPLVHHEHRLNINILCVCVCVYICIYSYSSPRLMITHSGKANQNLSHLWFWSAIPDYQSRFWSEITFVYIQTLYITLGDGSIRPSPRLGNKPTNRVNQPTEPMAGAIDPMRSPCFLPTHRTQHLRAPHVDRSGWPHNDQPLDPMHGRAQPTAPTLLSHFCNLS